jgi:hypothetical protein
MKIIKDISELENLPSGIYLIDATGNGILDEIHEFKINFHTPKIETICQGSELLQRTIIDTSQKKLRDTTTYIDDLNTFLPSWYPKFWLFFGFITMIILGIIYFQNNS